MGKTRADTQRLRFTAANLNTLKAPKHQERIYVFDAMQDNLAVCITNTGTKTFYRIGRIDGRPVRMKLGRWDGDRGLSIEQARKLARAATGDVARGINPHQQRQEKRGEPTLQDLFEHWLNTYGKPRKKTWPEDVWQFNKYLGRLRGRRLSLIRRQDVQALHSRLGTDHGQYTANRVRALLSAMFARAADIGWEKPNPCSKVTRFREQTRDRFLQPSELPRFFAAVEAEPLGDFFKLALFTGARCGNVKAMAWADIDLDRATWKIPTTKNDDPQLIPLVGPALDMLIARKATATDSPWVFTGSAGHVKDVKKAWSRIIRAAKLPGLRIHDLRRSNGSWQAAAGVSLPIIGKALGHKSPDATLIYARLQLDPVRAAVDTAVTAMIAAAKGGTSGKAKG